MDALTAITGTFGLLVLATLLSWTQIREFITSQMDRRTALE
ncbi:hypothetical protein ACIRPH_05280 [Nocardiopsis sp. NPDC101807]